AALDALLAKDPDLAAPLVLRAVLYREAGEEEKAIPLLRRAVEKEPSNKEAQYQLGQVLARAGASAEAERGLEEFQRLSLLERLLRDVAIQPESLELKVQAAELLIRYGRSKEAAPLLRQVLARDPNHAEAQKLLANVPHGGPAPR